jgi:hypothetical protein
MFYEVWEIFGFLFVWLCRLLGSIWKMAFLEREGFLLSFSRIEAWSYRSVLDHGAIRILDSFNTIVMISWYLQMIFKRTITRFIMTSFVSFSGRRILSWTSEKIYSLRIQSRLSLPSWPPPPVNCPRWQMKGNLLDDKGANKNFPTSVDLYPPEAVPLPHPSLMILRAQSVYQHEYSTCQKWQT